MQITEVQLRQLKKRLDTTSELLSEVLKTGGYTEFQRVMSSDRIYQDILETKPQDLLVFQCCDVRIECHKNRQGKFYLRSYNLTFEPSFFYSEYAANVLDECTIGYFDDFACVEQVFRIAVEYYCCRFLPLLSTDLQMEMF